MIANRAEHKDATTLEKSCEGRAFNALDVFDPTANLTQVIAEAEMDHHPFVYDPAKRTPAEQQRWVFVERHARSNPPPAKDAKK